MKDSPESLPAKILSLEIRVTCARESVMEIRVARAGNLFSVIHLALLQHVQGLRFGYAEQRARPPKEVPMTKEALQAALKYRLGLLAMDCELIMKCIDDGPQYHNLDLLEVHMTQYRKLCNQVNEHGEVS